MEKNDVELKVNELLSKKIIEKHKLGRTQVPVVWVENKNISEAALLLSQDPTLELDMLDHLSAMEADGAVVLSYFLASKKRRKIDLVVRSSILLKNDGEKTVDAQSVSSVWQVAAGFENEIAELFGLNFVGALREQPAFFSYGIRGFPLRKKFKNEHTTTFFEEKKGDA